MLSTLVVVVASLFTSSAPAPAPAEAGAPVDPYVLGHEMRRLDGTPEKLEKYKGKIVLLVNTASKCGLTGQYEGLEALYREHKEEGFVILGFPANNFMGQEPGSNEKIAEFCRAKYDVTFPMFEKISVKGDDTHPLYEQLAAQAEPIGGEPKWNFTKFLVNREGRVVARFEPRVKPTSEKITGKIEELLGQG